MARFNYAVCYLVDATCQTPLRTGGTEKSVLCGADGLPMIQGGSIAGVLRSYLALEQGEEAAKHLFGASEGLGVDSMLTVSDGRFQTKLTPQSRPRLRIDRKTGAGEDGKLFHIDGLPSGTIFSFHLLLKQHLPAGTLTPEGTLEEQTVETLLRAMHAGEITIGGQRSNGFGAVKLAVRRQRYDLTDAADRTAWIQEEAPQDTVQLELNKEKAWGIQFVVTGQMSSVLVRSGRTERREDQTVALPMQENGHYLLPASSLKGCVRSQAERIASYLRREDLISTLFGEEAVRGFTGTAAKLRVHECRMEQVKRETVITRTCINRFTGGVMEKRLFSQVPVSGHVRIQVDLVRPTTAQERAILFYALRDLAAGLYSVGSGNTIGYGYLSDGMLTVHEGEERCTFRYQEQQQSVSGNLELVETWLNALEKGDSLT